MDSPTHPRRPRGVLWKSPDISWTSRWLLILSQRCIPPKGFSLPKNCRSEDFVESWDIRHLF